MPYFIAAPCIDVMDKSCIEECPVDCIYEGDRKLYINPREVHLLRGLRAWLCPESAIFTDFKAPPDMTQFVEDNQRFFTEPLDGRDVPLGSPGGSGKVGRVGADTESSGRGTRARARVQPGE